MRGKDLAVIIPTRDRWPILRRTLDALVPQADGAEIIVVVDGMDQSVPALDGVKVLVVPRGGPGSARNRGVAETSRPLVLFLGDDMIPSSALVSRHLDRHKAERDERVAVLGHVEWEENLSRKPLHRWLDRTSMQFDFTGIPVGEDAGWGRFYSCNVSLKRSFFLTAGGFDPDFLYYYEDLDAAWRLHQAGLVLRYEPRAEAFHLHEYDLALLQARFAGVATGERMMSAKHSWFEPWFERIFRQAQSVPPVGQRWAQLDRVQLPGRLGAAVRWRADRWYMQQIALSFLDTWDSEVDLAELRSYLGDRYDHSLLVNHWSAVQREEEAAVDERTFYRTSEAYLYDLTVFSMSGTKTPYRAALRRFVPRAGRLLDYGCGIGSDGLRFLADGFAVDFADFSNPSTEYLRWRLARRGFDRPFYDIEGYVPGGYDAAYSFDVIEHVDDPFTFLEELEQRARIVAVNLLEPDPHDTHLHKSLPIDELVRRARRHRLLHHEFLYGRSHLLIYRV